MKRIPYIHEIFDLSADNKLIPFNTIKGKKNFKSKMIELYSKKGFNKRLVFCLYNSPNDSYYEIIPWINNRGNKTIYFTKWTPDQIKKDAI